MALRRCRRGWRRAAPRSWATARWRWAALGHHDEAIAEAGQALDLAPDSAIAQPRAGLRALLRRPAVSDAIGPIERALEIDPSFTPALRTLALAQTATGKADDAVDVLQRALRHNPLDPDAILQLSFLHIERGSFAEALETLEPYLKAAPDDVRGAQQPGPGAARPQALRRGAAGVEARLAASTDDPMVLTNLGARPGRSRPGRRSPLAA